MKHSKEITYISIKILDIIIWRWCAISPATEDQQNSGKKMGKKKTEG